MGALIGGCKSPIKKKKSYIVGWIDILLISGGDDNGFPLWCATPLAFTAEDGMVLIWTAKEGSIS